MKKIVLFVSIILFRGLIIAQTWSAVGSGINYGGYVNTLFVHDSVMYAGGVFNSPGNNIAQWNGTTWDSLGSGINNEISSFALYKGNLYIGGWFSRADGHPANSIAEWNGASFINADISIEGAAVNSMQVYDSLLYIGGANFDSVNHAALITPGIVSWDGSNAQPLGAATPYYTDVSSMAVYGATLYIGEESASKLVGWNNSFTFNLGSQDFLDDHSNGSVYALDSCNGGLYAGGAFNSVNSTVANNIAEWNGNVWIQVGLGGVNGPVYSLISYKNLLFVGGSFDSAGGYPANNIAMWNGIHWTRLGDGVNGPVYTLAIFNGELYAGGYFTSPAIGIAKLNGPLGIGELNPVNTEVEVYPNPNDGKFAISYLQSGIQNSEVEVYNILGEKVYASTLNNISTQINLSDNTPGIYLYRVLTETGNSVSEGKFIIQR